MEKHTTDILCYLILFFVALTFVFDLPGAAFAALKKRQYKSMIGSFVENLAENDKLWWFPLLIALLFVYGFYSSVIF